MSYDLMTGLSPKNRMLQGLRIAVRRRSPDSPSCFWIVLRFCEAFFKSTFLTIRKMRMIGVAQVELYFVVRRNVIDHLLLDHRQF